ncbi:MAG: signal peptidase I [Dehalococcoidia bacterium]
MTTAAIPLSRPARLNYLRGASLGLLGIALGLTFGALLVAILATRVFDYELLTVRSGSMEPTISRGDLIVVKPVAIRDVKEGDIILFSSGGDRIPTVHRVAGINEVELRIANPATGSVDVQTSYRLVTRGDANPEPDLAEVTSDQLVGEVWFTVPGGGSVTGLPLQYILLGVAGMSLIAWGVWELRLRRRRGSR